VTPEYEAARNYKILAGRFITPADMDERARVVVIGQTTLNQLCATDEGALGATLRINGDPFRIVGLLDKKGATPFGDEDDTLIVPFSTATSRLFSSRTAPGRIRIPLILVQLGDPSR